MDRLSALPSELLDLVCQFVQLHGHEHIASLRSCSHCLTETASQYLFAILVIGAGKRLLRRIKWVAARPHFAKGVREIEYDVTRYTCYTWGDSPHRREWLSSLKIDKSWMPILHHVWNLDHDQKWIASNGEVFATLKSALPYFQHVSKATVSNRVMKHQSRNPFDCLEWAGYSTPCDSQGHGYHCLFRAFAESSNKLREFSVYSQNAKDDELVSGLLFLRPQRPGILPLIQTAFEHLTVVSMRTSLSYCLEEVAELELGRVLRMGLIAELLACASGLRRLSLTFRPSEYRRREVLLVCVIGEHKWDFLEDIELDGIDVRHATELCDFLNRHSGTITTVTLRNINLMDGEWMEVANSLQGLPQLRGLLLEGLEVKTCEYLDYFTVMEIIDCAMRGRHNDLISDMDTFLGSFNFS